jgi:5'-3' exonuclease/transcription antitermination factor NusG
MAEWVVLELSPRAEGEDPEIIRRAVRNSIRGAEVFVPASVTKKGQDKVIQYLVDGYAFVLRNHPDQAYYRLEGTRYVQGIISSVVTSAKGKPQRKISCVLTADIDRLKSQIKADSDQGIGVGDTILITSGTYKHITATVIEDLPEVGQVQVEVRLRSKETIVTLPRTFLQFVSKAEVPSYLERASRLKGWIRSALEAIRWPAKEFEALHSSFLDYTRKSDWILQGAGLTRFVLAPSRLEGLSLAPATASLKKLASIEGLLRAGVGAHTFIQAFHGEFNFGALRRMAERWVRLDYWHRRGQSLTNIVFPQPSQDLTPLESKYLDWAWLSDVLERTDRIESELDEMSQELLPVQNVIVDGHNLAFRCLYAPGMSELADSKGRPTGIILGFLRSLASLRKRFPEAALYVCWDGSSKRRKDLFADYKANRASSRDSSGSSFDQIAWLRGLIPSLGVVQAFHPGEEADDVIATLVRGKLQGQHNVIYSMDRDLFQLVTETDWVLTPAQGVKKEALHDVASVEAAYGVKPGDMVLLRAFLGDSSDNIPGVARVPTKILTSLVCMYGSVDGIYKSSFAGLTKLQYEKIREAETQIRLNERLMALDTTLDFVLTSADPDQNASEKQLQDVEVKPNSILTAFFGRGNYGSNTRSETDDERLRNTIGSLRAG